jgi:hypothetical protein
LAKKGIQEKTIAEEIETIASKKGLKAAIEETAANYGLAATEMAVVWPLTIIIAVLAAVTAAILIWVHSADQATVTNEELAAHLDIRNATICAATLADYGEAGSVILKLAENGMVMVSGSMFESGKQYMAFIDGIMYSVYERNGEYVASKYASLEEIDAMIATAKENLTIDYLTYNEEGRYYSLHLGDGQDFYFYFENGQLVRGAYVINYGSGDGSMEIHFIVTDVGTTIVDLPEFTVSGNS